MPQFKDPKNPALSSLNRAKKRVIKNEKIQYSRLQPDKVDDGDDAFSEPASGTTPRTAVKGMAEVMSQLDTLASEVMATISFYTVAGIRAVDDETEVQKPRDAVADLASNSSAMITLIKKGQGILASANYDLTRKLSNVEIDSIISDVKGGIKSLRDLNRINRRVNRFLTQDLPMDGRTAFLELYNGIMRLVERWEPSYTKLLQDVDRAIARAKSGVSATITGGRMLGADGHGIRHVENVFGGALKSLTGDGELLTMGYRSRQPLIPLVQSFAPRNMMDLPNLPRRFL